MSGLRFRRKKLFKITRRTVRPIFLCCLTLYSALCGPRAAFEGARGGAAEDCLSFPSKARAVSDRAGRGLIISEGLRLRGPSGLRGRDPRVVGFFGVVDLACDLGTVARVTMRRPWVAMDAFVVVLLVLALGHRWSLTASWFTSDKTCRER